MDAVSEFLRAPTLGIIESRPIIRSGLISLLSNFGGVRIVGAVPSVKELPDLGEPELLICGLDLPGASPLQVLAFLGRRLPRARVFGIRPTAPASNTRVALLAGWISVSSSPTEIARVLGIRADLGVVTQPQPIQHSIRPRVTAREREVLELIARAYSNRLVAVELGIAEGTVKRHLTNLFEKFGATSRMQLVSLARNQDLVA